MFRSLLTLLCSLLVATAASQTPAVTVDRLPSHPRLVFTPAAQTAVKHFITADTAMRNLHAYILRQGNKFLTRPHAVRKMKGRRLLDVSRAVEERVLVGAYLYITTADTRFAVDARDEMLAAAAFADWNPSHFLDVGEMTAALALGYDWLYDFLSPTERTTIARAILDKGLNGAENPKQMWFYTADHNWNQVCNGGLVTGALAIADLYPEAAAEIVTKAVQSNPRAQKCYAPDGIYPEGYGYWSYGTSYEVLLIEVMRSALGSSFGLEKAAGFLTSAQFMNFMAAPSGRCFSFSDSAQQALTCPLLFWFAAESANPSLAWRDYRALCSGSNLKFMERRMLPLALIYAARCDLSVITPPSQHTFTGGGSTPVHIWRSGWANPTDTYLGVKGGCATNNHAHMDCGSFVFEYGGARWAEDLGSQSYNDLEQRGLNLWSKKQDSDRWKIFRWSNLSHNTLTVNGKEHIVTGKVPIIKTYDTPDRHGAQLDMSALFSDIAAAMRTVAVTDNGTLTVIDSLRGGKTDATVMWVMCTPAKVSLTSKTSATLTLNGENMTLCYECKGAKASLSVLSNDPPHDYDLPSKGTCRVAVTLRLRADRVAGLRVTLTPKK